MAFFTGIMLLILTFVAIPLQVWGNNDVLVHIFGFIHGWGFIVYLVTVADLGLRLRWNLVRIVLVAVAGTVPFCSFIAEHQIMKRIRAAQTASRRPDNLSAVTDAASPRSEGPARPVLVVDFGAQYAQLIARRVREANVYSEIVPHTLPVAELLARDPAAVILSGGPSSVYAEGAPSVDPALFAAGVPVLGICYGFQAMALALGRRRRPDRAARVRRDRRSRAAGRVHAVRRPGHRAVGLDEPRRRGAPGARRASGSPGSRPARPWRRSRTTTGSCTACSGTRRSCTRRTGSG